MTEIEVESNFPSFRLLQGYIKDRRDIEMKLLTGEVMSGKVFWQDVHCICLQVGESEQPLLVWRQAIAYIQPKA
jgi:host factor-I protein